MTTIRTDKIKAAAKAAARCKFAPAEDRYLIKQIEQESQTRGGLVIPEAAKQRPMKGKIVAAGPGRVADTTMQPVRLEMLYGVGQVVIFPKYAGVEIRIDEEDYLVVKQHEIMGRLEE